MISIIIPTYNRASSLENTLASIVNQDYKEDNFEVIVIDNGSTDHTKAICAAYEARIEKFVYNYDDIPGLLTGRHKGFQLAEGSILCFIDDDVELSANWLNGIAESFRDMNVALATGPCLPRYEVPPPAWLDFFWDDTPYGGKMCTWLSLLDLGSETVEIDPNYVWGLNFSIRKSTLADLGGFHPDCVPPNLQQYQGDGETGLTMKAGRSGLTALYNPKVMLYHTVPVERMTLEYFEKRAYYQGVCNSFTDIRRQHYEPVVADEIKVHFANPFYRLYNAIKRKAFRGEVKREPSEILKMKENLSALVKKGYQNHQRSFENDRLVKEWVLKANYWDFKLPQDD